MCQHSARHRHQVVNKKDGAQPKDRTGQWGEWSVLVEKVKFRIRDGVGSPPREEECGDRVEADLAPRADNRSLHPPRISRNILYIWKCNLPIQLWPPSPVFLLALKLSCTGCWHPRTGSPCGSGEQGRRAEYSLAEGGGSLLSTYH